MSEWYELRRPINMAKRIGPRMLAVKQYVTDYPDRTVGQAIVELTPNDHSDGYRLIRRALQVGLIRMQRSGKSLWTSTLLPAIHESPVNIDQQRGQE